MNLQGGQNAEITLYDQNSSINAGSKQGGKRNSRVSLKLDSRPFKNERTIPTQAKSQHPDPEFEGQKAFGNNAKTDPGNPKKMDAALYPDIAKVINDSCDNINVSTHAVLNNTGAFIRKGNQESFNMTKEGLSMMLGRSMVDAYKKLSKPNDTQTFNALFQEHEDHQDDLDMYSEFLKEKNTSKSTIGEKTTASHTVQDSD